MASGRAFLQFLNALHTGTLWIYLAAADQSDWGWVRPRRNPWIPPSQSPGCSCCWRHIGPAGYSCQPEAPFQPEGSSGLRQQPSGRRASAGRRCCRRARGQGRGSRTAGAGREHTLHRDRTCWRGEAVLQGGRLPWRWRRWPLWVTELCCCNVWTCLVSPPKDDRGILQGKKRHQTHEQNPLFSSLCNSVCGCGRPHLASPCCGGPWWGLCAATCAAPHASSPPWLDWGSTGSLYVTGCRSCSRSWQSTCWGRGCGAPSSSTHPGRSDDGQRTQSKDHRTLLWNNKNRISAAWFQNYVWKILKLLQDLY